MPPTPQPIKIQLAIQGGGAKIVALMAALEALEDRKGTFQVTRIVGTSAGALAGVFFASNIGIKNIVDEWRDGSLEKLLQRLALKKDWWLPANASLMRKMYCDDPIWPESAIHEFLENTINKKSRNLPTVVSFDDLKSRSGIEVAAVTTNLHYRSSEVSLPTYPVVQSLISSAGLPYLLRKWGGNPVIVDGGIGDNLPSAQLDLNLQDVTPVGISFKPRVDPEKYPKDFKSFSMALLDVAMEVSTKKSAELIPNTLFIDTSITTIDFHGALAALRGVEYEKMKVAAGAFFDELEKKITTLAKQNATAYSVTNLHPWQSENLVARAVMSGVWEAISKQFGSQLIRFHQSEVRATLGSLMEYPQADVVTTTIDIEAGSEALYCYYMGVADGVKMQLTKEPTLTIVSLATGEYVPHVRVPAISSTNTSARYEIIFFTPPLAQGTTYRIIQVEEGMNFFRNLSEKRHDDLGVNPNRVLGTIKRNRLVIDVPNRVEKCIIQPKLGSKYKEIKQFSSKQPKSHATIATMPGYDTHVVEAVDTDGVFGVDISID